MERIFFTMSTLTPKGHSSIQLRTSLSRNINCNSHQNKIINHTNMNWKCVDKQIMRPSTINALKTITSKLHHISIKSKK